ncbi:MAG: PEGA domain-containing protein [Woeseiaceae bacterium]|nr:PEGA domain-containing protein [Woeseiaceae bacterium]
MKFDAVMIHDAEGRRRVPSHKLPLRIGTGAECELRLPGPGSNTVALLDQLDGEPFVQPVGRTAGMQVNGKPLTTSRRLTAGDTLEFFGTRLEFADPDADGQLDVTVHLEDSAYITRPPDLDAPAGDAAEEAIAPSAFQRAADVRVAEAPHRVPAWQWAVAAGVVLLIGVSFLLFTSRSIQFDVQPGGADDLRISGGWFRLPVGDRVLLREGSYTVHVEKTGYYDVNQSLQVGATPSRTITIEMRRLPGRLTVSTDPPVDAVVTVDSTEVGPAPFGPLELEPGTHTVAVRAADFLPYEHRLTVPGLGLDQRLDVQLVPRWAEFTVRSEPTGATIYRDQEELGETPATLRLAEGSHALTVVKEGFAAWDSTVEATANEHRELPLIELEPANARLEVNSVPLGANVTVNGRYRGQAPVRLALSPDVDYRIGLSKAGYGSTERQVRLEAAASRSITVDLTARVGRVTINAWPEDAVVYVDGRSRGRGSLTLELPSAPHELEVRKEGYETFSRSVTPRPGYPQTIQVRLLSHEEVRRRSIATTVENTAGQTLRRVEPGSFTMGASRRQQGRRANEVLVPVSITRPFYIGTREVTNAEFLRFRADHDSGDLHASLAGNNNPVVNVSWADAVEYCNWLSAQEGLTPAYVKRFEKWEAVTPTPDGYRLPTEAEWAWAIRYQARAEPLLFPWGDRLPPRRDSGNYADQSASELVPTVLPGYNDGYASTAPVGSFPANALDLYDGGGNVAEWVQDYYAVPTPGQTDAIEDPTGPARGSNRVIRGSSWRSATVSELRLSYREFGTGGRVDLGFRIARNAQ